MSIIKSKKKTKKKTTTYKKTIDIDLLRQREPAFKRHILELRARAEAKLPLFRPGQELRPGAGTTFCILEGRNGATMIGTPVVEKAHLHATGRLTDLSVKPETVAKNLKTLRGRLCLTQKELSNRSRVPQQTIAEVELGRRQTRLGTLLHLAEALGVSLAQLTAQEPLPATR